MRAREAGCLAHVVGRYDEPGLPEGYEEGRALYLHDRHLQLPRHPNVVVHLSTDPRTEGLRSNLLWALRSWRQLKGLLRGPGARQDAFAQRCPHFRCARPAAGASGARALPAGMQAGCAATPLTAAAAAAGRPWRTPARTCGRAPR